MFQTINQQGTIADDNNISGHMEFEGVIPYSTSTPTDIQPTIQTVDADGTNRYFDLQGRLLNGKPDKGLYIENGKIINR